LPAVNGRVETKIEGIQGALFTEFGGFGVPLYHSLFEYVEFVLQEQLTQGVV